MVIFLNTLFFVIAYFFDTAKALDFISVFGVMPDTVFVTLLCFCMFYGKEKGLVLSVAVGLLTDIVTSSPIGAYALLFLTASVVCGITYETIFERNLWTALVTVFVLSLGFNIITFMFQSFASGDRSFFFALWRYMLPTCLFNTIITPVIYTLVGKVYYRNERVF